MKRDVVVIGASAGGVIAVSRLLAGLPPRFPGSVFVVVHIPTDLPSSLPEVLRRHTDLDVVRPADGAAIRPGRVYVAPTDRHLLIGDRVVRVLKGPRENRHRPAIDPLFRSAAFFYRRRAVGVLLTGADSDGTSGLFSIKMRGGVAVVQDPEEALFPMMPGTALNHVDVDHNLRLSEIPPLLGRLALKGA
jgi:two-component system, chemotaxis family, protein-glutamate methylesterase/glutaminase